MRTNLLLGQLSLATFLLGVSVLIGYCTPRSRSSRATVSAESDSSRGAIQGSSDAGAWVPLEKLEYMAGPWRTEDGDLLVSVVNRGAVRPLPEPDEFWVQPWRMTLELQGGSEVVCGMYEGVQEGQAGLSWRLGYCKGSALDPKGPAVATRVSMLRMPGFEGLRLIMGNDLDVLIYQVR